jgi:predicted dehydrogenase
VIKSGTEPLRVGILGAGFISPYHAKAIQDVEGLRLVAICDRDRSKAESLASLSGGASVYTDLDAMLAGEKLNAIHVLLPAELHEREAEKIVANGVHIFLEKPMCISSAQCSHLREISDAHSAIIGVSHNFLFYDIFEQLRSAVSDGALGRLSRVEIAWAKELPFVSKGPFSGWLLSDPGNAIIEVAPHSVSQIMALAGYPEKINVEVCRRINLPNGLPFFGQWMISGYAKDVSFFLSFDFTPGFTSHVIRVYGSGGYAEADFELNTVTIRRHTGFGADFNRYLTVRRESADRKRQANATLAKYVLTTLKLANTGKLYLASITKAVAAFYAHLDGVPLDYRINPEFGEKIVDVCERISRSIPEAIRRSQPPVAAPSPIDASEPATRSRVLVLGGTGFLGKELVRQLVASGEQRVRVLSRGSDSSLFAGYRDHVEIVTGSMSSEDHLRKAMEGIEVVYHLARSTSQRWSDSVANDIEPTEMIGRLCLELGVRRLLYTGTISSLYTAAKAGVIRETTRIDIDQ